MSGAATVARSEAAILSRVVRAEHDDLPPEAARSLLKLGFDDDDRARMHELAVKGQRASLSKAEDAELESYCRVARLLDLMHSKARRSLKKAGQRP
jgi:hypothetical protein